MDIILYLVTVHMFCLCLKHRSPCTRDTMAVLLFTCNLIELGLPRDASWMGYFV